MMAWNTSFAKADASSWTKHLTLDSISPWSGFNVLLSYNNADFDFPYTDRPN